MCLRIRTFVSRWADVWFRYHCELLKMLPFDLRERVGFLIFVIKFRWLEKIVLDLETRLYFMNKYFRNFLELMVLLIHERCALGV